MILFIAICWTAIDLIWIRFFHFSPSLTGDNPFRFISTNAILLRGLIVFVMSSVMGFLLLFRMRQAFRDLSLLTSLFVKTGILLVASLFMNFLLHFTYSIFILHLSIEKGLNVFYNDATSTIWLLHHSIGWLVLFLITQLSIDFYEKYSPGVFWDILIGRYIRPKEEQRIVMFLDLIDSTPIGERLDSQKYFSFIRDFIYFVSVALLEYDGRIYQYVGDEIIASWPVKRGNEMACINSITLSEKLIRRNGTYFRKRYGRVPEFRVGIHVGIVTIGEIGIIKKDIAMSGDTMNTTARIRESCNELNRKYMTSKDFLALIDNQLATEYMGAVDLKGKNEPMDLYALKI